MTTMTWKACALAAALAACGPAGGEAVGEGGGAPAEAPREPAAAAWFEARNVRAHMEFLASDLLEGREAGTRGYQIAARYVASQFAQYGLTPAGAEEAGYFQPVGLRRFTADLGAAEAALIRDGSETPLDVREDFVLDADPNRERTSVTAPAVFVGYGVIGGGRDDYKGVDVEGKIAVALSAAPPGLDSSLNAHLASTAFKEKTASEQGAAGFILVMAPESQRRYAFSTYARFAGRPNMTWVDPEGRARDDAATLEARAVFSEDAAAMLFEGAEMSYAELLAASEAGGEGVRSFALPARVRFAGETAHEDLSSDNVVGYVEGSDPALRDEYVVLTAHLDHVGISDRVDSGDRINNGALDNAAGTAALLEVARVAASRPAPRRSLLFLALTAEEKGLIGADYFARRPTVPKDAIVANINLDMPILLYDFTDMIAFGASHSSLGPTAAEALAGIGVTLSEDPLPEQNLFRRSDHYRFVQQGVPSLFLMTGFAGEGEEKFRGFLATNYHRPGDDLSQDIDFAAGAKFARANYEIMTEVANADARPTWNAGDYFGKLYGGPMAEPSGGSGGAASGDGG